jgi:hypothetical protein
VSIQVLFHDEEVELLLGRMETALSPIALSAFMSGVVGPFMLGRVAARFEDEGDSASGKWQPLKESTNQIREQMGYPPAHPINIRSRELFDFTTTSARAAAEPFGASVTLPDQTPMGELFDKFITAQGGAASGENQGATPPRPVLAMDTTDLAVVLMQLGQYFERAGGGVLP